MKDYYKILGVEKSASDDEIKKAYRKLAHEHHPDKKGGNASKFKEINEAYQILSNKARRKEYDRFGTAEPFQGFSGQSHPFEGFDGHFYDVGDLGEIFDSLFENFGFRTKRKTYHRGSDLEASLEITLEEAFRGVTKHLKINTLALCNWCHSRGVPGDASFSTCAVCGGQGEIKEHSQTFFGNLNQVKTCSKCLGTGQIPDKFCFHCGGSGRKKAEKEVAVTILPGIEENQIIKIKGAGEAGERGNTAGDLYVRLKIKAHPTFERIGSDLIVKKELPLVDVLLGKNLQIPTIHGDKISVEIPAHFNLKEDLKIKGQGMPHFGSYGQGDLLVRFHILAPKKPSPKAKKILEDLENDLK